ncbi:MAG: hypothetical protein ABUS57_15055 [Pseudomonadota bacterium]
MTEIGEEKVRAGHTGDGVRAMLGWSLAAATIGLFATLIVFVT